MTENEFTKYTEENESNIIPFMDEFGNKVEFELIDAFKMGENEYAALIPVEENEDDDEDEVLILRIEHKGDEDVLIYVEEEDELDSAFDVFKDRMGEEYDIID